MMPGNTTVSPVTVAPKLFSATVLTKSFGTINVASSFRMSTTNNRTSSAPSSAATSTIEAIRLSLRSRTNFGAVVSNTDTRNCLPSTLNSLLSMRSNSASEKAEMSDLASNISEAYAEMSMPRSLAKSCAIALSSCVVVGERNSSVSDKMHDNIAPFTSVGICAMSLPIIFHMIVAVQAKGSMRMSIGPLVSRPPTNLW